MVRNDPVDTGHKLDVHKTFRRRPGRLLKVLCTFNLRPVSTGESNIICIFDSPQKKGVCGFFKFSAKQLYFYFVINFFGIKQRWVCVCQVHDDSLDSLYLLHLLLNCDFLTNTNVEPFF